jgi:hypothetical protein
MAQTAAPAARRHIGHGAPRRAKGNGDRRLDLWVSTEVYLALERLAHRYGITKRQMLERLVSRKDDAVLRPHARSR